MDNSPAAIKAWLETVFQNCDLFPNDIKKERAYLIRQIDNGTWWRGYISEYLRDNYGHKPFLRCDLYL